MAPEVRWTDLTLGELNEEALSVERVHGRSMDNPVQRPGARA